MWSLVLELRHILTPQIKLNLDRSQNEISGRENEQIVLRPIGEDLVTRLSDQLKKLKTRLLVFQPIPTQTLLKQGW